MPDKARKPTVREHYQELKTKRRQLESQRERIAGKIEEQKKERARKIKRLKELGVKNPEDEDKLKKHISRESKALLAEIKRNIKEVDDGIARLTEADGGSTV
jgi:uncharacterized protein YaaN involved in tellurite resistance